MFLTSFAICCAVILLGYVATYIAHVRGGIPGPVWSISKYYRVWLFRGGIGPYRYVALHKKYGPIVRTGPNHVSLGDPELVPVVYDLKYKYVKSDFYEIFKPLYKGKPVDTVFTTKDRALNKRLKHTLVTNVTGVARLYEDVILDSVRIFGECMLKLGDGPVSFDDWAYYWGYDITAKIVFGEYFGYMSEGRDIEKIVQTFKELTRFAALLGFIPSWCRVILGSERTMSFLRRFQEFPDPAVFLLQEIDRRIELHEPGQASCGQNFLCKLFDSKVQKNTAESLDAVNSLFEAFFASAVELAVTTQSVVYFLCKDRRVYHLLADDLRKRDRKEALQSPYLTAVIKEALRLYTSNCPPMERHVPEEGLHTHGMFIPGNTIVSVSQYFVHRNTDVYGADAENFRPERWLEASEEAAKRMESSFLAFGKGNRGCTGRDLGMLELRTFFVETLRNFDFEFANKDKEPHMKMYWLVEYFDLTVRFTKRGLSGPKGDT